MDASLVLYETADRWSGLLRRVLRPSGVRLVQAGSLAGVARELFEGHGKLVAVEVRPATLRSVLELLERAGRSMPRAGVIVLADRGLARLEGVFREAGALHCEFSPRDLRKLARLVERWWANHAAAGRDEPAEEGGWPQPLANVLAHWQIAGKVN